MEDLTEKIEKYLTRQLPPHEMAAFRDQMNEDPQLKENVMAIRIAQMAVNQRIENTLRKDLVVLADEENLGEAPAFQPTKGSLFSFNQLAIAAAILTLITLSGIWLIFQQNSYQQLADSYYQEIQIPQLRNSDGQPAPMLEGIISIKQKEYQSATNFFQQISAEDARYPEAQFYLANISFLTNDQETTQAILDNMPPNATNQLQEKGEWLYLLSLLKEGRQNQTEFLDRLAKIQTNPDHFHQIDAFELMKDL